MLKLSPSLKAFIDAPSARPRVCPAPANIRDVYQAAAIDAVQKGIGLRLWLALSTAATFALHSPESLSILFTVACNRQVGIETHTAEFMREVGLKCISIDGVPRTISCLIAFYENLPIQVSKTLCTKASRQLTTDNLVSTQKRGRGLWDFINKPFENKVVNKLALAHPDLPVHILDSHYGTLLSDPPASERDGLINLGGFVTSMVLVASMRALTGVGQHVFTHMLAMRKYAANGKYRLDQPVEDHAAILWLAGDEGSEWILAFVDKIVQAFRGGDFALQKQSNL